EGRRRHPPLGRGAGPRRAVDRGRVQLPRSRRPDQARRGDGRHRPGHRRPPPGGPRGPGPPAGGRAPGGGGVDEPGQRPRHPHRPQRRRPRVVRHPGRRVGQPRLLAAGRSPDAGHRRVPGPPGAGDDDDPRPAGGGRRRRAPGPGRGVPPHRHRQGPGVGGPGGAGRRRPVPGRLHGRRPRRHPGPGGPDAGRSGARHRPGRPLRRGPGGVEPAPDTGGRAPRGSPGGGRAVSVTVDTGIATRPAAPPATMGRAARIMGAATAVSRILGFGRVLVIAAVLGTTDLGNTFSASNSVSNVLFDLLAAGALSAVLVPAFVELLERHRSATGDDTAEDLAGALLGWSLLVLGPICLAGVLAAPALARLLTAGTADPGVAAAQRHLATFLLRLFVPQVLLYAVGAVTTAVLHAKRRFTVTAVAPIGNTVMMVLALGVFRALHGPGAAGFDLTLAERLALGAAGTLGVAAFVAIPAVALRRTGFRLRIRVRRPSAVAGLGRAVRLSGWAGVQHAGTAVLLAAALLVGMGVPGGVVAYQVAFACFLVPYAVLALPLITAVLPE